MLKIKAEKINSLTDARYFAAKNVDYISYDFNDPKIDFNILTAFTEWIEGPKTVIIVSSLDLDLVFQLCNQIPVDFLQLDIESYLKSNYHVFEKDIIVEVDWLKYIDFEDKIKGFVQSYARPTLQINFEENNTISTEQLKFIANLSSISHNLNIIVNADLKPEDIETIFAQIPDTIICIKGSDEEKVGLKSFDETEALFDIIEQL
jgi:phosphoribosylanthranilate isomerase